MKTVHTAVFIKITIFVLTLTLLLTVSAFALADTDPFAVSEETYETTYDELLEIYIKEINSYGTDNTDRHDLFNELIISDFDSDQESPVKSRITEAKSRVGFCIYDLNNDGISELIIGENPSFVFEVFTVDDGRIRELIRAGYHYDCALLENELFYRRAKGGGGWDSFTVWGMNGTEAITFEEGYIRDAQPDDPDLNQGNNDLLFFKMTDINMRKGTADTLISSDEFLSWLKGIDQNVLQLSFIPLSLYEQGFREENKIGIVSVNGKTQGNSTVRIRAGASRKAKVLKNCKAGTYVIITGEEGNYYKISFNHQEGYIQKEYLMLPENVEEEKKYGIGYESYENWINSAGSVPASLPSAPAKETEKPVTPDSNTSSDSHEEYVIDHYENVEVQKSRRVIDHYETYYTYEDDGQGHFVEMPHERPVYTTEYYTETVQQPVYRRVGE